MCSTTKRYKGITLYRLPEVIIVIACIVSIKLITELHICIYGKADFWHIVLAFELNIRAARTLYLDMWNLVCCEIKCFIWDLLNLLNHIHWPFTVKWKPYVGVGFPYAEKQPCKCCKALKRVISLCKYRQSSCWDWSTRVCGSLVTSLGVAARKTGPMTRFEIFFSLVWQLLDHWSEGTLSDERMGL
jgi:hypothetical protein